MKNKGRQIELSVIIGMALAVFCAGFCDFAEEYRDITGSVFRLHIPANSDSMADQYIKLKVRDAVLEETADIFSGNLSAEEAAAAAENDLDRIKGIAERVLRENNCRLPVKCEVTEMFFDDRAYGSINMPAGKYLALRISIGSGEGKNWWCVMFPPLCLPAVSSVDEALEEYDGVFTEEELDILHDPENYECKFYFLELFRKVKDSISNGDDTVL